MMKCFFGMVSVCNGLSRSALTALLLVTVFSAGVDALEVSDFLLEAPRKNLEEKGISFSAVYDEDMVSALSGGLRRGTTFIGKLAMSLTLDLSRARLIPGGTAYISGQNTNGGAQPSVAYIGDLQGVDNIAAPDATRIYECWYEQNLFNEKLSILVGIYDVNSEFAVSQYGSLFIQSSFGMPPDMSVNVPTSVFPILGPSARVKIKPFEQVEVLAGVFDGDPTDGGKNKNGVRYDLSGRQGIMAILEVDYHQKVQWNDYMEPLPGSIKFGSWLHTGHVDDMLETDENGDPVSNRGDYGFYGVIDQLVFREKEGEGPADLLCKLLKLQSPVSERGDVPCGLGVFLQCGGAPEDRNTVAYYFGAGLTYTGLIPYRKCDMLGIAVANAFLSPDLRKARNRDIGAFDPTDPAAGELPGKLGPNESYLEITYRIKLNDHIALQPDYQIIFNPGGEKDIETAHVFILRFEAAL